MPLCTLELALQDKNGLQDENGQQEATVIQINRFCYHSLATTLSFIYVLLVEAVPETSFCSIYLVSLKK